MKSRVLLLSFLLFYIIQNTFAIKWLHQVISKSDSTSSSLPPRSKFGISPFWSLSGVAFNFIFVYGVDPSYTGNPDQYTFLNVSDIGVYWTLPNSTELTKEDALYVTNIYAYYSHQTDAAAGDFFPDNKVYNFTLVPFYRWGTSFISGGTATPFDNISRADGTIDFDSIYQLGGQRPSTQEVFQVGAGLNVSSSGNIPKIQWNPAIYSGYPLMGHTAVLQYNSLVDVTVAKSERGRIVVFGGYNGTSVVNELLGLYIYPNSAIDSPATRLNLEGDYPSPRMFHTALTYSGSDYMILFGGTDGNNTFYNDLYILDLSQDLSTPNWTKVAIDNSSAIPAPRAGHSMIFGDDSDVFYVFGGETNDGVFLNDFWKYSISANQWTELTPNGQPAPDPRAYHQAGLISYDGGIMMFFYGGENSTGTVLDTFEAVDLYLDCEVYCKNAFCATYAKCIESFYCLSGYMCNFTCIDDPKDCVSACSGSLVSCFNGVCVSSLSQCRRYPTCLPTEKRCSDGLCHSAETECTDKVTCASGEVVGPDGVCRKTQIPYSGCLPDGNAVQCYDGTCAATLAECNTRRCNNSEVTCFSGCRNSASEDCELPYWTREVHDFEISEASSGNTTELWINEKAGKIETNQRRALLQFVFGYATYNSAFRELLVNDSYVGDITVRSSNSDEILAIGPHPTWLGDYHSSYFPSIVVYMTYPYYTYVTNLGGLSLFLLNYQTVDGESLTYSTDMCLAAAVDWYWDSSDCNDTVANTTDYFASYYSSNCNMSSADHPTLRWKCLNAHDNYWPLSTNTSGEAYLGIVLDSSYTTHLTLIKIFSSSSTPTTDDSTDTVNKKAHYIILGFATTTLLVLIVIVGFKALTSRH